MNSRRLSIVVVAFLAVGFLSLASGKAWAAPSALVITAEQNPAGGGPWASVVFNLTLTNNTGAAINAQMSYAESVTPGNPSWITQSPTTVYAAAGQSSPFTVGVKIPNHYPPSYDNITITATIPGFTTTYVLTALYTWSQATSMPAGIAYHNAVFDTGTELFYIFGGFTDAAYTVNPNMYTYDLGNGPYGTGLAGPPTPVGYAGACTMAGVIYMVGGWNSSIGLSNLIQIYNIAQNHWTTGPTMPNKLIGPGVACDDTNNRVWVAGGRTSVGGGDVSSVLYYDVAGRQWVTSGLASIPALHTSGVTLKFLGDGKPDDAFLYFFGGGRWGYYPIAHNYWALQDSDVMVRYWAPGDVFMQAGGQNAYAMLVAGSASEAGWSADFGSSVSRQLVGALDWSVDDVQLIQAVTGSAGGFDPLGFFHIFGGYDADAAVTSNAFTYCWGCNIGGTCYPAGSGNPNAACQYCDVGTTVFAWTNAPLGASCDDGLYCNGADTCDGAGACHHSGNPCPQSTFCETFTCVEAPSPGCVESFTSCPEGYTCDAQVGQCVAQCSGCVIDSVCYSNGAINPANICLVCNVASSNSAWSNNDGVACDDAVYCNGADTCSGGTCSVHAGDPCANPNFCQGTATCDEQKHQCDYTGNPCPAGYICDWVNQKCVDLCSGCEINGVCYGDGQANPTNPCLACVANTSTTAWTPIDGGTCLPPNFCNGPSQCQSGNCVPTGQPACPPSDNWCLGTVSCNPQTQQCVYSGDPCPAGTICDPIAKQCVNQCSGGCTIDGVCWPNGATKPGNICLVCNVNQSTAQWSNNDGVACDDGTFCDGTDSCQGGSCSVHTGNPCPDDGVYCDGQEICDEQTASCGHTGNPCPPGKICDEKSHGCVDVCVGCLINNVCWSAGMTSPDNKCEICNPDASPTQWSPNDGGSCDDGLFCDGVDTCVGDQCRHSGNPCPQGSTCDEKTDSCIGADDDASPDDDDNDDDVSPDDDDASPNDDDVSPNDDDVSPNDDDVSPDDDASPDDDDDGSPDDDTSDDDDDDSSSGDDDSTPPGRRTSSTNPSSGCGC